jgi:hypothetical protein
MKRAAKPALISGRQLTAAAHTRGASRGGAAPVFLCKSERAKPFAAGAGPARAF